jgi:hypothetical protein
MNLNYSQTTGIMTKDDGSFVAKGWAGNDYRPKENPTRIHGKNNPAMESVNSIGPLPKGAYAVGSWGNHGELGPNSASLTQTSGDTFGRSGFFIHGPGGPDPSNCSKGCIVISHDARMAVIALRPDTVTVTE